MYLVTSPRPDLVDTISFLVQFSSCPAQEYNKCTKHVFRYVNGTGSFSLFYTYTPMNAIDIYVDADFAGCYYTRRCTSGYIVLFNNWCISWLVKKQSSVPKSTAKAEFVTISYGTRQIRWLLKGLADLSLHVSPIIQADNTGVNILTVYHQINV